MAPAPLVRSTRDRSAHRPRRAVPLRVVQAALASPDPTLTVKRVRVVVAGVRLTGREQQLAALVAEGWSSRRIAVAMGWQGRDAVKKAMQRMSWKIPGKGTPREIVIAWWVANAPAK